MSRDQPVRRPAHDTDATRHHASWVEVDAAAHAGNLRFVRQQLGSDVELAVVVKSNAYGHGLREIAGLAVAHGADSFCVYSLDEALALRAEGIEHDILVLGYVPPIRFGEAIEAEVRLALFDPDALPALAEATGGRPCRLHLKVETGTHRHGIDGDRLPDLATALKRHPQLLVEGVYTHFANIEDTTDRSYARGQLARFEDTLAVLAAAGIKPARRHTACSAAVLAVPETSYDMVRLGIAQYGIWPSKETLLSYRLRREQRSQDPTRPPLPSDDALTPVLTWKTRIAQLREVPTGRAVGYGGTYQTTRPTRLAVLPVGYGDGYDRRLSNQAYVVVNGHRAPVRGRVCMNVTLADVTDVPEVAAGDEVVLLGRQGPQAVRAEQHAAWIGTIPYEVVTRIAPHLPRLVV